MSRWCGDYLFMNVALQCMCLGREEGLQLSFVHVAQSLILHVVPPSMSWCVVAARWGPSTIPVEELSCASVVVAVLLPMTRMFIFAAVFVITVSAVRRPDEGAIVAARPARPLLATFAFAVVLWLTACALGTSASPGPRVVGVMGIAPVAITATVVVSSALVRWASLFLAAELPAALIIVASLRFPR